MLLFLSNETSLYFDPVFIGILDSIPKNLLTFQLLITDILWILKFIQRHYVILKN